MDIKTVFTLIRVRVSNESHLTTSLKFFTVSIVTRVISFLLYPLLSRHFTVSDFGSYDVFVVFTTIMSSVGLLGLDSLIYRYLNDTTIKESKVQLVSNVIFTQVIVVIIISFILYLLLYLEVLSVYAFKFNASNFLFLIIATFGMVFYSIAEVILRIGTSFKYYGILSLLNATIFVLASFAGLSFFELDMLSFQKLYAMIYFFLGLVGLYFVKEYISFSWMKLVHFSYLSYAFPLCLMTLIPLIQSFLFRNYIGQYLSGTNLGVYAAAARLTLLYTVPAMAVYNTIVPILLRSGNVSNYHILANKYIYFNLVITSFCLLMLTIFSEDISIIIFGSKYIGVGFVMAFMTLGLYLQSLSVILSLGSLINNGTKYRFLVSLITFLFSYCLAIFLVPKFGLSGVLISSVLGNLIQLILDFILGQSYFKIEWEYGKISLIFFSTILLHIIFQNYKIAAFGVKIILALFVFIFYIYTYKILVLKRKSMEVHEW